MGVQGTSWSVAWSFGWCLAYGVVLYFVILGLSWLLFHMWAEVIPHDSLGEALTGMRAIYVVIVVLSLLGGIVITYKSLRNPYEYGWADAEDFHKITAEKRKCSEGICVEMP